MDDIRFYIAICYGVPPAYHGRSEPLFAENLRPLCSPETVASLNLNAPADLVGATLVHSANALTWVEYLRRIGCANVKPHPELWFDRSTMAIDAAINGLGVILESEILAGQELREGRLVAPFTDSRFEVEATTYFLVSSASSRNRRHIVLFEKWLRGAIASANIELPNNFPLPASSATQTRSGKGSLNCIRNRDGLRWRPASVRSRRTLRPSGGRS